MIGRKTPIIDGKKTCCNCQQPKPLAEFIIHRSRTQAYKNGEHRDARCDACRRIYNQCKNYGLTPEEHTKLVAPGICAVCRSDGSEQVKGLHIDHDHITGRVRGLLCQNCNLILGHLERIGLTNLPKLIEYLA